jgi:outer membrane protein, adhesin transport system
MSVICGLLAAVAAPACADPFTIHDAIKQAIQSHPGVGEAAANRRATETELRQTQSTLLPQVRLVVRNGYERLNQKDVQPAPLGNGSWRSGFSQAVVVRQLLFDGFASINDIWRQAARVDAAAARVHERTELIALDAAEAYIEVTRFQRLIAISEDNVSAHRKILANVRARFEGGRAGEGDLQQAEERVANAEASLAEFKIAVDEARAKYRSAVGMEPFNLRAPGRLRGLPASRDESLAVALRFNPTIQAAQRDADAAKYAFHSTAGAFVPTVTLEGTAQRGINSDLFYGNYNEATGKVVFSWDVFRGGQDMWRRAEMGERYIEQTQRWSRLQREAYTALDKAWAARTLTADRIAALERQIASDRRVIAAYTKEYELGQRSLIDLLNANNQMFNGLVSVESSRSVAVFADYQLLAAMGRMMDYLKTAAPAEALPLPERPFAIVPVKIPPVIVRLPEPNGPEPLNVAKPNVDAPDVLPKAITFQDRWSAGPTTNPSSISLIDQFFVPAAPAPASK